MDVAGGRVGLARRGWRQRPLGVQVPALPPGAGKWPFVLVPPYVVAHHEQPDPGARRNFGPRGTGPDTGAQEADRQLLEADRHVRRQRPEVQLADTAGTVGMAPRTDDQPLAAPRALRRSPLRHRGEVVQRAAKEQVEPAAYVQCPVPPPGRG